MRQMPAKPLLRARCALRRFLRETDGAVAVEFALVFGVLILLVFGAFEFGRAVYFGNALEFLTDKAARSSILTPNCALSQNDIASLRDNALGVTGDTFNITPSSAANGYVLQLGYSFDLVAPIYGDKAITVTATRDLSQFCSRD
jgi:Flp pilus assembly protein TadG